MPSRCLSLITCKNALIQFFDLAFCAPHNKLVCSTAVLTPSGVSSLYLFGRASLGTAFFLWAQTLAEFRYLSDDPL